MNTTLIIKELYSIFNSLNDQYFGSELPDVFITIQQGKTKTKNSYGTFFPDAWAHKDGTEEDENGNERIIESSTKTHEIAMSGEYMARPFANLCATLCHEMVHLYCQENGIKDTSNKGVYHNAKFKMEAEKRGLIIEQAQTIGWSVTTPSAEFIEFVNHLSVNKDVFEYFRKSYLKEQVKKSAPKKRWVCPICATEVIGKKDIYIGCWDCKLPMDYWDLNEDEPTILIDNNHGLAMSEDGWFANNER